MIRLAIAEDHQSLIDGIKLLLEYEEDIEIVGTANDGEALLDLVRPRQNLSRNCRRPFYRFAYSRYTS